MKNGEAFVREDTDSNCAKCAFSLFCLHFSEKYVYFVLDTT